MTNDERLKNAAELIEYVWNDIVPDKPPVTVAEEEYFDFVDETAARILSDIQQMRGFVCDRENMWG